MRQDIVDGKRLGVEKVDPAERQVDLHEYCFWDAHIACTATE
jgi:hypothetical protein